VRSTDEHGLGFDAQWADDLHHALHVALTSESQGYYRDFARYETAWSGAAWSDTAKSDTAKSDTAERSAVSGHAAPDHAAPDHAVSDHAVSDHAVSALL